MLCFLLAVILFCSGVLLYLAYRDQKQEKNSYRTNTFHICRIEVLEERDFLSASPLGDFYNDDNDDYEPPYNPSDTYIEYNAYSNAAAQQNSAAVPAAMPDPIYAHNLLNDGTSLVTSSSGNYYELTAERAGTDTLNALNSATNLTIAATFNVDSVNGWHYIAAHDCPNNTGAEVYLRIRNGKLQFGYWDTYQDHLAETAVSANTWYSVAGTFDGTAWKLYV
ncbi:MAG: LamG domain-containing protein, partial [Planctomycetaceae bacterium]|nr:LamG domain-containing protein [Planctomycetaceae bacterium]